MSRVRVRKRRCFSHNDLLNKSKKKKVSMKLAYSLLARKLQSEEDNVDTINIASRRFFFSSPADGAAAGNCLLKGKNYAFHQGWVPFSVAEPFQSISGHMSVAATPGDPNGDGALISAIPS